MSRRKQANPRPLKTIDGNVGPDDGIKDTDIFKVIQTPPEQTNGHCLSDSDPSDEYDEFTPAEMEASGATDSQDDGEDQGDDKKPDSNLSGVNLGTHRSLPRLQPERRKLNPLPAESLSATKLLYGQSLLSLQDLRQGKPVQSFSSDNNIPFNDSHDSGSHHLSFGSESSENGKLVIDLKDSSFETKTPTELNLSSLFAQNGDKLPLQLAPPTITSVPPFSQPSSSSVLSSTLSLSNPLLFGATTSQATADNQDTAVSGSAITGSTLSPSALSSSISSSKTHRRGKRNNSVILNGDCKESSEHREDELNDLKILPVASESGESQYICPICSTALATSHDLTVHIRSHNTARPSTQSNTCTICGKTLSSQSSLDRHMLVHSGERPFQCKYCKMSFTTNGNMHRHMRIHTKEAELNALGVKVPKKRSPAWKPKNFVPIEPAPPKSQLSSITIPATSTPIKTELAFADSKHLLELSLKSGSFQPEAEKKTNFMDYTTEMHLAGNKRPYNFINYSPADVMTPSKKSKSLDQKAKIPDATRYQQFPLSLSVNNMQEEKKMEEDKMNINDSFTELKVVEGSDHDLEQLHCPVCNKTFLCKAGFEAHLETHPNLALKCNICQMALPTLRALNMHKLMLHSKTRDPKEEMEIEGDAGDSTAIVGFYDLSFTDFSVEKFSLIAKAWCEDNARKSCSSYHNYLCKECLKAFPCKSALKLHSNTHSEEKTSKCPLCEGDFMDTRALHMHMIKHMSDIAFGEAQKVAHGSSNRRKNKPMPVSSNSDKMEEIGKHDFLASFGLTAKIEPASDATSFKSMPKRQPLSPHTFEKRENNNYFAKMGHIYDPNVSPIRDSHSEDGLADFADFAKMLQNLTPTSLLGAGSHSSMPMGLDQYMSMLNPAQMAAFSFPMMPFSLGNSGMSLASMAAMMNPGSLGSMVGSDRGLLTPPNNGSSSPGLHLSGEMSGSKIVYPCKYCDMVFPNYRALKGHTRTHLGLSPYKCNLCTYSSADKSTLIRHLRTHNGERPFQCLVCDFAFTTKANCERHVRKKHGKCMKDDIESAIGYNKYVSEQVASMDSFHSPDTVCKYCGIDFKFFRALKHHLRSHSSCRQKPFQCTKCEIGFSTKANCIRHLQKQHKEISQNQIEAHILVNEPSIMDDADSRLYGDMSYDEGLSDRDSNTPSSVSSSIPPAHTNQNLGRSRYDSPAIKMEPLDASLDGPLDFSVRSGSAMGFSEDAPMDLSMKKPGPSMTPDTNKQQQQPQQLFECPQCTMSFSTQKVFSQHLVLHELSLHQPEKQQEFIRMSQLAEMESNEKLGNMRLRLKPAIGSEEESHVRQMGVHEEVQRTSTPMRVFGESSQLRKQLLEKIKKERQSPLVNHVADTNYDLASVKTIIDNTTSKNNFHSFLIENMNDSISQNNMDMNDDKSDSEGALVIEEPPVESPMSKADSSEIKSEYGDEDLSFISSQEIRQQIQKAKALESNFLMPNQPSDKQSTTPATKKKRNSYADSPHKLQCPYCTRTFPWVSSLTRHLLTHTGQKPFKCPKCPVTFSTKSNRERHLIRKHGVNMLDPLSRQTMDRPYKCHLCVFSSFSTQGNLLKHYKERHNDDDLPESLRDLDQAVTKGLAVTLTGEERIAARDKALGISNIGCNSYIAEEQMNQNMQEESRQDNSYLCIDENSGSRSENENEDEMDDGASEEPTQNPTPPPPFPPSLPAPSTTSLPPSSLPSSILSQLPSDEAIKNLIKKDNSPSVTGSAEKQINPERDNYNVDKITECWKCGESFISRKLLVRHLKEHSIDLPFKCYLCDASFDVRVECLNHQEKFHSSDWSILKEKNKVETIDGFSKHMDKVVENNLNKVDQGVVLEIPGHNPDDPKMEVVSADYMQRKVYCSLCPKRFWSLQDLRRHMRSHTGERPFECDICQKRFTLKHSMMRHRKKHSDPGSMSPSDDEDSNSVLDDSMGTKTKSQQRILPKISASPVMTTPSNQHSAVSIATSLQFGTMGSKGGPVPILPALVDSADSISGPKISLGSGTSGVFPGAKENKYIMDRERPRSPMATNPPSPSGSSTHTAVERDTADILHSLLGVEVGSIDKMLDSADNAALLLGVQN